MTTQESIEIAFQNTTVYEVLVTSDMPEIPPFTGHSDLHLSSGGTEIWFVSRVYVVVDNEDHSGWYKHHWVSRTDENVVK